MRPSRSTDVGATNAAKHDHGAMTLHRSLHSANRIGSID